MKISLMSLVRRQPVTNPVCYFCDYELDDDETHNESCESSGDCELNKIKCPACKELFYVRPIRVSAFVQRDRYGKEIVP